MTAYFRKELILGILIALIAPIGAKGQNSLDWSLEPCPDSLFSFSVHASEWLYGIDFGPISTMDSAGAEFRFEIRKQLSDGTAEDFWHQLYQDRQMCKVYLTLEFWGYLESQYHVITLVRAKDGFYQCDWNANLRGGWSHYPRYRSDSVVIRYTPLTEQQVDTFLTLVDSTYNLRNLVAVVDTLRPIGGSLGMVGFLWLRLTEKRQVIPLFGVTGTKLFQHPYDEVALALPDLTGFLDSLLDRCGNALPDLCKEATVSDRKEILHYKGDPRDK